MASWAPAEEALTRRTLYDGGVFLAIDSSAGASVAIVDSSAPFTVLSSWRTSVTNSHAEVLAGAVRDVMAQAQVTAADLKGIVVGAGPGPFTGLRVGLVLAHTLSFTWGVPLAAVCSLDSLALRAVRSGVVSEFLVATDARRREVYWSTYRASKEEVGPGFDVTTAPAVDSAQDLPSLPTVGAGVGLYAEHLHAAPVSAGAPDASCDPVSRWLPDAAELGEIAARSGTIEFSSEAPVPLYLRESDAKVPRQMRKHHA